MKENNNLTNSIESKEIETSQHSGPHIPKIQGESVYGAITNVNIATFLFFIIILVFAIYANKVLKKENSRLKTAIINFISILDKNISETMQDKKFARAFFPLVAGFFIIILFGNLFGLIIDWAGASISPNILSYLRPINSDLNTTLVLGIITVVTFLGISIKYSGLTGTTKGYLFNFSGHTTSEKFINVFVGWLHLISIPSTIASLSLRLFGNIFAGVIIIGIITYLGHLMSANFFEIGRIISIPFWFFEIFVAFIQSAVFLMLMMSYFNQSKESHH